MRLDHRFLGPKEGSAIRALWLSLLSSLMAGCVTQRSAATLPIDQVQPPVTASIAPTKVVVTCFEVRGYVEPTDPTVRHEAHTVYRRTRVPFTSREQFETEPGTSFPPATYNPLPASAELAAEVASQKTITSDMLAMQARMAETERRMQRQYGELVRQSTEATKLRQQLEAERNSLRMAIASAPGPTPPQSTSDAKW